MNNKIKQLSLLLGDIIILYLSLFLTLVIRYKSLPNAAMWANHFWPFTFIFVIWLIIFYIFNLYNLKKAVNNTQFFITTLKAVAVGGLIAVLFFYLNPNINIAPKTNLLMYLIIFTILFILWRRIYNWVLGNYFPKNNVAIIGYNSRVKELIKEIDKNPGLGFKVFKIITNESDETIKPYKANLTELQDLIKNEKISVIVLAANLYESKETNATLFSCLPYNINIVGLPDFYEQIAGKIMVDGLSQIWFLENLSKGKRSGFDALKKIADVVVSLIVLLITLPFWPIIALIIKAESKGPIFFKQIRAGKNNKEFTLIKFRTMKMIGNNFSPTSKNDARITRFGGFMRKTRIDELPQMLNILAGEMSFVGPRPERPEYIAELEKQIPFYKERMLVKPGLTGVDQISGEYHSPSYEDTIKKLQYDLFYIKNRSIYLDLSIVLKTIATVLGGYGR